MSKITLSTRKKSDTFLSSYYIQSLMPGGNFDVMKTSAPKVYVKGCKDFGNTGYIKEPFKTYAFTVKSMVKNDYNLWQIACEDPAKLVGEKVFDTEVCKRVVKELKKLEEYQDATYVQEAEEA